MYILGISCFYHDSAAALIHNGEIVAAAQEERFTRKKHDQNFPINAINFCLNYAGIKVSDLSYVAFYDKPLLKFHRLLLTYLSYAPVGFESFVEALPIWLKQKFFIKDLIMESLNYDGEILFPEHHYSHAASAFFPSPFKQAAFLTLDGVGEWTTTSYGVGKNNKIEIIGEIKFPHSLGLLYSAFTYFCGFKVNSGEYKLMGLAPHGRPIYADLIKKELIDIKEDGSFRLNLDYFDYMVGLKMTSKKMADLFGGPARKPETFISQREMDLAASIQFVTEEIIDKLARNIKKITGEKYLCMAGGVALNCVANGKLLMEKVFDDIWIQPAAGDAGGAVGAALMVWYQYLENERKADNINDFQKGSYLGPEYSNEYIERFLKDKNVEYEYIPTEEIPDRIAELIEKQNVIGWFQGRMEFGPRALGARSILGDARSTEMQSIMNLKIKYRESFRPFAPSVLEEDVTQFFESPMKSPYMLLIDNIRKDKLIPMPSEEELEKKVEEQKKKLEEELVELQKLGRMDEYNKIKNLINSKDYIKFRIKIHAPRSDVPAITHVNYSGRLQTVNKETNPLYYKLIEAFKKRTGYGIIINTSFNVRGEPIVCSPQHAFTCFLRTEMDYLIMGNFLIDKKKIKDIPKDKSWMTDFDLD
ncbi:MAG TPA: carbamoyltransferase [bacterium]|nr:carbamoyltransferase [bacterium]HOL47951.1 carbamoyltransferase [bacterium]HPQ19302.1 carbamoyltransferase [bacterium]